MGKKRERPKPEDLQLLEPHEVARLLSVKDTALKARRRLGKGPAHQVVEGKTIRYRLQDLEEWQAQKVVRIDPLRP